MSDECRFYEESHACRTHSEQGGSAALCTHAAAGLKEVIRNWEDLFHQEQARVRQLEGQLANLRWFADKQHELACAAEAKLIEWKLRVQYSA